MAKIDELQEELDSKTKERNSHGRIFDESDLCDLEQRCKITGMSIIFLKFPQFCGAHGSITYGLRTYRLYNNV